MTELASRESGQESMVGHAQQQVQDKAREVRGQVSDRVRQQVDERSTQAGDQLRTVAQALRSTGDKLREEGNDAPAKMTDTASERLERLAEYLSRSNADTMMRDVERAARGRPWAFAAGGLVLGLVTSRFLRASSQERYQTASGGRSPRGGNEPEIVFEPDVELDALDSRSGSGHGA
jgi:hypothetical protein